MTHDEVRAPAVTPSDSVGVGAFLRAIIALRTQAGRVLILTVILASTEWIGLFLIVPLLAVVGLRDADGPAGRMADVVTTVLGRLGIPAILPAVLAVFLVLVSARAAVQRLETSATSALENDFVLALRKRGYAAILRTKWEFFSRQRGSYFLHVLTSESAKVGFATYHLLRIVVHVALTLVYLALAIRISPAMTALASTAGVVLLVSLRQKNTEALAAGAEVSSADADLQSVAHEQLMGMKTARSYGTEERNARIFDAHARNLATASSRAEVNLATSSALLSVGSALLLAAFVYVSVAVLSLPTTAVLLLLLVFSRIIPRVSDAQTSYQQFLGALPAYGNVMRTIAACEAAAEEPSLESSVAPALTRAVTLTGVTFRYTDAMAPALSDISLEIRANETTAIVGPSGAGKSTIADLLLGILTPTAGVLQVDGRTMTAAECRPWRTRIGFVPQETFLLHDSVRANLLWARPDASEDELREALSHAAAQEFVDRLPHGIDTRIGDRGVLLSGGERQRLALARALLRAPDLLILDEATSALDSENEQRIHEAISRVHGRLTIVIITHRLSAIRDADTIHVLDGGRVVQSGPWHELIQNQSGRFWSLCMAQGVLGAPDSPG